MRKVIAWLGAATLLVLCSLNNVEAGTVGSALKPYVVLILDTSGSMATATNSGPPSCGGADTRLNHARCAINDIANSYGDLVLGLARFRETVSGTYSTSCTTDCNTTGVNCNGCNTGTGVGAACTTLDDNFELLAPLLDGTNSSAAIWTDNVCNTCGSNLNNQPDIFDAPSYTPLSGVLNGDKKYWLGQQATNYTIWPAGTLGFAPIANDPTNGSFLSQAGHCSVTTTTGCYVNANCPGAETCVGGTGTQQCDPNPATCSAVANCTGAACCCASQCRPYITILLTDGGETCTKFANTTASATSLLTTDVNSKRYRVVTKPIGFGVNPGDASIEGIAHAGGAVDDGLASTHEGYYAADQAGIELAISQIIAGSLRTESCNNLDDDCDTTVDEDFPTKGNSCDNSKVGYCKVNGTLVCRADGTGVTCDAGTTASCNGQPDGHACTVTNAANTSVPGTCTSGVCYPTPLADVSGHEAVCGNGVDDDCDGFIDEGCASCVPTGEICNGLDDDCDGSIDEGLTRACGTGSCTGTETCNWALYPHTAPDLGYGGCNAAPSSAEKCDGLDNNCDGVVDGFTQQCSNLGRCSNNNALICTTNAQCGAGNTCLGRCSNDATILCANNATCGAGNTCLPVAGGPSIGNPGDPANNPIQVNICHPGSKSCASPPVGNGTFTTCVNEVVPQATDPCDGLDNDCDNVIDEDFTPANCSTNCGVGTTMCVNGQITCNSQPSTVDNTCNNIDDDCDGLVDEDWVCDATPGCTGPNCCSCGTGTTCEQTKCINGNPTCTLSQPINPEQCNCLDDNCNGQVDEGTLCPGGATCTNCQCAFACSPGEFPCPLGKKCLNQFCVNDPCYGITCPAVNGRSQTCVDDGHNNGVCTDTCDPSVTTCPSPLACYPPTGECKPDDCTTYPDRCTADQNCINGVCVSNPCQGVTCTGDQYCVGGQCFGSCADVTCPSGQRCRLGSCEADPCGHPCPFGQACNDTTGHCIDDPCTFRNCPTGQWCNPNDGQCEDDPCVGTMCPGDGQICRGGTCYDPTMFLPDAGVETHVTVGGGGCNTGGGSGGAGLLLGIALVLVRRSRRSAGGAS